MQIPINQQIFLSEFNLDDKFDLVTHLDDKEVTSQMLTFPHPYTEKDAEEWIYKTLKHKSSGKTPYTFAIRHAETGEVIGGIGMNLKGEDEKFYRHQAEIGYWIAKEYWNKALVTEAVKVFTQWAFKTYPFLIKITALVFTHNPGSMRALEKAGFTTEGLLRRHIYKSDNYFDCKYYGLLKDELFSNEKHDLA